MPISKHFLYAILIVHHIFIAVLGAPWQFVEWWPVFFSILSFCNAECFAHPLGAAGHHQDFISIGRLLFSYTAVRNMSAGEYFVICYIKSC